MRLEILDPKHFPVLHEIHKRAERFFSTDYEGFCRTMGARQGFVIVTDEGKVIGCISFSNYTPNLDIMIHCTVDPDYQGKWFRKNFYKAVFADYAFGTLGVERVSAYTFTGVNDRTANFLKKIGFKHEGTIRRAARDGNGFCDSLLFGLLKKEVLTWQ
jgi:RimJ/RimL family protein N-acetyltransferase